MLRCLGIVDIVFIYNQLGPSHAVVLLMIAADSFSQFKLNGMSLTRSSHMRLSCTSWAYVFAVLTPLKHGSNCHSDMNLPHSGSGDRISLSFLELCQQTPCSERWPPTDQPSLFDVFPWRDKISVVIAKCGMSWARGELLSHSRKRPIYNLRARFDAWSFP